MENKDMDLTPENTTVSEQDSSEINVVEATIGERVKRRRRVEDSKGSHHSSRKKKHRSSYKKNGKKKMKTWKKVLISIGCVVLAIALFATGTLLYLRTTGKDQFTSSSYSISAPESSDIRVDDDGRTIKYNGRTYKYKKDNINMLFMGIDKHEGEAGVEESDNQFLADVIIVSTMDPKTKKITLVNVPRDLMTDVAAYSETGGFSGMEKMQIALAYSFGSTDKQCCLNCLDAVRRVFYNIPINAFYSLEMGGISTINDSIGGVDVKSPEDVYYTEDAIKFKKGEKYHLTGEDARYFVQLRSHKNADANLKRNERQRIYLTEFMKKTISLSKSDLSTPINLYNTASDYSCTNMTINGVTYLATELLGRGNVKTETETLPVDVKQVKNHAENYLREKEFYEQFLSIFYDEV